VKVLLVQSYLGGNEPVVYPIGLACLVSSLKNHEIRVFDSNLSANPFQDLGEIVKDFHPDIIGISLRNIDSTNKKKVIFYYPFLKETVGAIKSHSAAPIVLGGSGFSMFAAEIMKDEPRIDIGVMLEGEASFQKLLEDPAAPHKVKSVYYRKNGEVIFTGGSDDKVDLDAAALPDRKLIPVAPYKKTREAIGIESKRGCALTCVYCIYGFLNGKKMRLRSAQRVVDEIEMLAEEGVEQFTFVDSVFNLPQDHAVKICTEIKRRGLSLKWSAWFTEKGLTKEFIELLKSAGCRNIILSPDGFSDEVLQNLGKNIHTHDIIATYDLLKSIDGFEVSYNFFKNPPGQSVTAFFRLIFFVLKAKIQMGRRVHFEFNSMRIEPNTKLYDLALKNGSIQAGETLLYPKYFTNTSTLFIEKIFNLLLTLKDLK